MALCLESLWKRGRRELGNFLFVQPVSYMIMRCIISARSFCRWNQSTELFKIWTSIFFGREKQLRSTQSIFENCWIFLPFFWCYITSFMAGFLRPVGWGPVHTNSFSNANGGVLLRIRPSSTVRRRKRSPKSEPFEKALQSGAIWKRCFLKTLFSSVDGENDAIWKRWRHQNSHDRAPDD